IPQLAAQLLCDPTVVKAGVNLSGDAHLLAYRYGLALINGVELSHLFKCLHPSPSIAPLAVQLGLAHLSARVLRHEADKTLQASDWKADQLTPAQIAYAAEDAQIAYHLYVALERQLHVDRWEGFNANAFTFNCAYVLDGRVVCPTEEPAMGRHVRLWGVFDDPSSTSPWTPKHAALSNWSKGIYAQCRLL
ncbi:ribonuclease H-like domain-containing protein, partial [Schizophyllum fasciatum]